VYPLTLKGEKMKSENLTEAQIAWILWNLHERLNSLLWDRYEKEFIDWVMDENQRKEMDRMMEEELDRLLESEF
jgi:hypothetical protein